MFEIASSSLGEGFDVVDLLPVDLDGRGDPGHARTLFARPNNLPYFARTFRAVQLELVLLSFRQPLRWLNEERAAFLIIPVGVLLEQFGSASFAAVVGFGMFHHYYSLIVVL